MVVLHRFELAVVVLIVAFASSLGSVRGIKVQKWLGSTEEGGLQSGRRVEVMNYEPRAFVYHEMITPAEGREIIEMARKAGLERPSEYMSYSDSESSAPEYQLFSDTDSPLLMDIAERMSIFSFMAPKRGGPLVVMRYGEGSEYREHHFPNPHAILQRFEKQGKYYDPSMKTGAVRNRTNGPLPQNTVIVTLSKDLDLEGGEDIFPLAEERLRANGKDITGTTISEGSCGSGLVVDMDIGSALLYYHRKPYGALDPTSSHAVCRVLKGERWVMMRTFYMYNDAKDYFWDD